MRELLIREPIPQIVELEHDVAVRAERLLGYSGLRKEFGIPGPLGQTLRSIGVEPFNTKSVKEYQWEARQKVNADVPHGQSKKEWSRFPISEYSGLIEPTILSRAIEIFELEPEAEFFVEELGSDPFLVVTRGREEYYIEVWGEEGF